MAARCCLVILAVCLLVPELAAQTERVGVLIPDATDDGNWYGSWAYRSRDRQMALFIREAEHGPQVKVMFRSLARPESFETGWDGATDYFVGNRDARFALTIETADANRMRATWVWRMPVQDGYQTDRSTVEMYRAIDGRSLVLHFKEYERKRELDGREPTAYSAAEVWSFRKVSKRIVLFDEIPF